MENYIPPISLRERDERVLALVHKGSASDDELFFAQFGEWPVRGLQKDISKDELVCFFGFGNDPNVKISSYLTSMAYAREDSLDRNIYLNRLLLSPLGPILGIFTSRMVYARMHDIVSLIEPNLGAAADFFLVASLLLSSYKYAAASSLIKLVAPSLADEIGQEHIHILDKGPHGLVRPPSFQAAARDTLRNRKLWPRIKTRTLQTLDVVLTWMPRDYFAADHELQARLHNVLVTGYPAWGKIPETTEELFAALLDVGIKAPKDICDQIDSDEENAVNAKILFSGHNRILTALTSPPSAEMNIGLNSYRNAATLQSYWNDCIPLLYADLLRKYGDSTAMERFGFSGQDDLLGLPTRPNDQLPETTVSELVQGGPQ